MKFIHCADLHLDTSFIGLSDTKSADIRQAELRRTFLSVVELAKAADGLFISGDLFDQRSVESETIQILKSGFSALGDIPVFIAAGNHDPLTERSYYHLVDFPSNVHIFGTEISCYTVGDCDIYGISFARESQPESLLEKFPLSPDKPSIFVVHGNLGGEDYNPISKEWVCSSGLSYLALGHVHSHLEETLGRTLCVYPGCPEGRGFDELGVKGVVSVTVTKEGASAAFIPLANRRYREQTVDVTGLFTHEEIIDKIRPQIDDSRDLYKIILTGETELSINRDILCEAFSYCFFIKVYDRTVRPLNPAELALASGLRGLFCKKMLPHLSGAEKELYAKALEYGLAAINGEKVKPL